MGTRALFGYLRKDGSLRMVYNHYDGGPNVLGKFLRKMNYEELVAYTDKVYEADDKPRWDFAKAKDADLELAQRDAEWFYVMDEENCLWAAPSDYNWDTKASSFDWNKFRPIDWLDNPIGEYNGPFIIALPIE